MARRLLKHALDLLLVVPEGYTGERAREYAFFNLGYWFGAGSHASYALVFALNGVAFMAWYNVVVAVMFAWSALNWQRLSSHLWLAVPLWLIEVPTHALLGSLFAGFQPFFWSVPLAVAVGVLVFVQLSWEKRALVSAGMVFASMAICLMSIHVVPLAPLTEASNLYLLVTNYIFIFGAMVLYVGINQYLVLHAERRMKREYDRAERLLRNILPDTVALRLKDGERVIADEHKEVSVVFADIVDFTEASARLSPAELVETLNLVFSEFDRLADKHGAEKIKTIGDAYMVVLGVPDSHKTHAEAAVDLALDMLDAAHSLQDRTHFDVRLRVGVNSGPVVAGVIGRRKFAYDLWGDAVNVASRMESHGVPGQILTTRATADLLSDRFLITPEGQREVKGKGPTDVFSVARAA